MLVVRGSSAEARADEKRILFPSPGLRGSEPVFTSDSRHLLLCGKEGSFHGVELHDASRPESMRRLETERFPKTIAGTTVVSGDRRWLAWPFLEYRPTDFVAVYGVHLFRVDARGESVECAGPVWTLNPPRGGKAWYWPVQVSLSFDGRVMAVLHGEIRDEQMKLDLYVLKAGVNSTGPEELPKPLHSLPIHPERDRPPPGEPSNELGTQLLPPKAVSLSPDGRTIAVGFEVHLGFVHPIDEKLNKRRSHSEVHFWNVETGEPLGKWVFPDWGERGDALYGVHWLPDGERLALVESSAVTMYRWRTRELLWKVRLSEDRFGSSWKGAGRLHPDGTLLAVPEKHSPSARARNGSFPSTDVRVRFVRTDNGRLVESVGLLPDASGTTLDFSPDGKSLLTGWGARPYRLWTVAEILAQREWGRPLNQP
jgi:WD40 repeat protein